jgi:hypothetical protein
MSSNVKVQKPPLREHRTALAANPMCFEADLPRVRETFVGHLRRLGYRRVEKTIVAELVNHIFEAQDRRPFFYIDATLPYCWNGPKDWSHDYIRYEWGHLQSRNQNADADQLENLALYSARCNQHIQTSMDISEVREWLKGSRIADRIDEVVARRTQLIQSAAWIDLCVRLNAHRRS